MAVGPGPPDGPAPDPRPEPPERPLPQDCCESGCDPCVFDVYGEEMDHYRERLAAWQARRDAQATIGAGSGADGSTTRD